MADNWPSHSQELERKAMSKLSELVEKHTAGTIKDRDLFYCVGTIWHVCSGLIPEESMRTIEAVHKEITDEIKAKHRAIQQR